MIRRVPFLVCALTAAAAVDAACSGGGSGGSSSITSGSYVASNYRPGANACNLDVDPSGLSTDVFAQGGTVTVANLGLTYSGGSASESYLGHFQRLPDPFGGGGFPGAIFCTLSIARTSTITITGAGAFDVTETFNVSLQGGSQCADAGYTTLPCTSTETWTFTRQGSPFGTPVAPTPTPAAVSGTLSASGSAPLVAFADTTGSSPSLTYSATLNGVPVPPPSSPQWLCRAPDLAVALSYNYTAVLSSALTSTSLFYLVVNTGSWAPGSVAINPDTSVWAEVSTFGSAGNLVYDATAQSGNLVLGSAGAPGGVNSRCGFSISAAPLSGVMFQVAPPGPPRDLRSAVDARAQQEGLKAILW